MGIPGLWEVLRPALQTEVMERWAYNEGFVRNTRGHNCVVLGIDASIWMRQTQEQFHKPSHSQMGQNPELRTLFYKLAWLLPVCVVPVFVFDGPARPTTKCGHLVRKLPHWMMAQFRSMIAAFGFHSYEAPGEAEAELAHLNRLGLIDAVVTDDSDAFVFGATCVIRNRSFSKSNRDGIELYTLDATGQPLTREDLILIGLLVGGDYDPPGLGGCGIVIAQHLVHSGLGRNLCNAMTDLSEDAFTKYLQDWRSQLRNELANDPHHLLGRRYGRLASQVQDGFPRLDILRQYAMPVTSGSLGRDPALQEMSRSWAPHCADIGDLASICQVLFAWGKEVNIWPKFEKYVWPGAILRSLLHGSDIESLIRAHVNEGIVDSPPPPSSALTRILASTDSAGPMPGVRLLRFRATTHVLRQAVLPVISDAHSWPWQATLLVWLPEQIARRALPEMVEAYHARIGATGPHASSYIDLTGDNLVNSEVIDLTIS